MPVITVDKLIPSTPSQKTGKMMPPKVKAGEIYYIPAKGIFEKLHEGGTYEVATRQEQNGDFTNHYIESATLIDGPAAPAHTNGFSAPGEMSWKDKLILAQSSAKTAADLLPQMPNANFEDLHVLVYNSCLKVAGLEADPFAR